MVADVLEDYLWLNINSNRSQTMYYNVQKLKNGLWYILIPAPGPTLSGRGRNWITLPGGPWSTKEAAQKIVQQQSKQVSWSTV
jgi:hypothetical protein